ncbi:MAG: InlB B-repeat-containing protein [Clostridia bacterium]|nr:InlB B-repeat-containing protein [Clostridia bacterium]
MEYKHSFVRGGIGVLSALLCVLMLIGVLPSATAEQTLPSIDYGIAGRESNTEYSPSELYSFLFGSSPTEAEADYLDTTSMTFRYNALIPGSAVSTDYDAEAGTLAIQIRPYTYTAANGVTVTWMPTVATVDGNALALTERDGVFSVLLEDVFYSEDFEMQVEYAWSTEIPSEVIAALRTSAYQKGAEALILQNAYEEKLSVYNRALAEYTAWTAYAVQKDLYDEYIEKLVAYQAAKEAYETYTKEYAQYLIDRDVYNEWVAYDQAMEAYTEQYRDQYEAYMNYVKAFNTAKGKLAVMDSLFVADSNNWIMYASIMGNTVDTVLKHKAELVDYLQCSEEDVDLAGSATEALRVLLKEYNSIRKKEYASDYEAYRAQYAYYTVHYEDLKLHFTDLYRTLNALFQNDFVERVLQSEGKREHYLQFVGQLYVISTCLDENGTRKSDWTIGGKQLTEVVEAVHLIADGDWDPRTFAFPGKVAELEEAPPTAPTSVRPTRKPEEPDEVSPPGKRPATVENPDKNGIPVKREEHPGEAPAAPALDALTKRLIGEVADGTLKEYTGATDAVTVELTETLTRTVSIRNRKTVNFYNYDGTLLYSTAVDFDSPVSYTPPVRENTAEYSYRFLGWMTLDGKEADLHSVKTDLDLYTAYESTKRLYSVTWRIAGADRDGDGKDDEYTFLWSYGLLPTPDPTVPISPYETAYYRYEFGGWDREIVPVTENVTYTGSMKKIPREFVIKWVLREGAETVEETWAYGTTPAYSGDVSMPPDSRSYIFVGWDRLIVPATGDATYTAVYEKTAFAHSSTGKTLEITHGEDSMTVHAGAISAVEFRHAVHMAAEWGIALVIEWDSGYRVTLDAADVQSFDSLGCTRVMLEGEMTDGVGIYRLSFCNNLWTVIENDALCYTLHLPYVREGERETAFFRETESGWERIEERRVEGCGVIGIKATDAYTVSVPQHELCNTLILNRKTAVGERVSLRLSCAIGYAVTGARVLTADGTEVPMEDLSFIMPASAVTVELTVEKLQYRVTFVVEGTVVGSSTYFYGDEIVLPASPTKADSDEYAYTFLGWGDVPAIASGSVYDLTFEAIFRETVKDVDYDTGNNNNLLAEVIIPCVLGGILVIAAGVTAFLVWRKRAAQKMPRAAKRRFLHW